MSFVPSTRECLHQLDRLRDTPQLVADLNEFAAELDSEMFIADPLVEASARLTVLHQLCLHLAANLSGGVGVPPTPGAPKRVLAAPSPAPHSWRRSPESVAAPVPPPAPLPPPPTQMVRARPAPAPKPDPIDPLTVYTVAGVAQRMGISTHYIKRLRGQPDFPKPIAGGHGVELLWDRRAIDQAAERRAANPPKRGRPRLSSTLTSNP